MTGTAIRLTAVSKAYGDIQALKSVSCEISDNEFFTLLGPSGCGKTTLLRMIGGFETPTTGTIELHGRNIQDLPAYKRRVNTVFQNYALFPHLSVADNIAFGLDNLRWKEADKRQRVAEMLHLVGMEQFGRRNPGQLSGGQKQRVALARALAPRPEVLLLDEPLSALDLKLRQRMREELKALQRQTGITFVFVTHDQEEALAMSDRICVLGGGEIQQIGTSAEIYENPDNRFVAEFIGESNFLPVEVKAVTGDRATVGTPFGLDITARHTGAVPGQPATLSLRPEKIGLGDGVGAVRLAGSVVAKTYMGGYAYYTVRIGNGVELRVFGQSNGTEIAGHAIGAPVTLGFSENAVRVLGR
jgi:spermidine/putrescine transport system ATP-binding protein